MLCCTIRLYSTWRREGSGHARPIDNLGFIKRVRRQLAIPCLWLSINRPKGIGWRRVWRRWRRLLALTLTAILGLGLRGRGGLILVVLGRGRWGLGRRRASRRSLILSVYARRRRSERTHTYLLRSLWLLLLRGERRNMKAEEKRGDERSHGSWCDIKKNRTGGEIYQSKCF